MPEVNEWDKPIVVSDIAQLKVKGRKVAMDLTEDAWSFGEPPAKGNYKLKVFLAKDGITQRYYDDKKEEVYFNFSLECKFLSDDKDVDGYTMYVYVSTRIPKRKNISTVAGLIQKMGYKMPTNELDDIQQAKLFTAALKKEPIIGAEIDWRASYDTGKVDKNTGRQVYKNVCNHYEDFPSDEEGGKKSTFSHTAEDGSVAEIRAQLFVSKWYGKGETVPTAATASGPKFVKPAPEPELEPVLAAPKVEPPKAASPQPSEGDLELVLN
jgi:hypothetical protein